MQRFRIVSGEVDSLFDLRVAVFEVGRILSMCKQFSRRVGESTRFPPHLGSDNQLISNLTLFHPFSDELLRSFVLTASVVEI